jgi:hypothetical protein
LLPTSHLARGRKEGPLLQFVLPPLGRKLGISVIAAGSARWDDADMVSGAYARPETQRKSRHT